MNESSFVDRREVDWRNLTRFCDMAEGSPSNLNAKEFHEFVRLYRRVSTDLATARTQSINVQLIDFLNDLVARAYGILYRTPRNSFGQGVALSILTAARTIRKCRWFLLLSLVIFVSGGVFSYFVMDVVPTTRDILVPPQERDQFKSWQKGNFEGRTPAESTMMTGVYATNNPRVAIISGASAAGTFGVGTLFFEWQNGAIMGSLAHELRDYGKLDFLFSSIAPHGVPEISGLIISGAAGFVMGWALINPGRRRRADALKAAGKDAIVLLSTGVCMMFIAAPIEGFFSFNPSVPGALKVTVAATEVCAWAAFWIFYDREDSELAESPVMA